MSARTRVVTSQTITRPADTTAYADNDLVANSTSAGSVTPFLFTGAARQLGYKYKVVRAALNASGTAITNGSFRLHLFTAAPTVGAGDNSALAVATNADKYIGYLEIVLAIAGALGNKGWTVSTFVQPVNWVSSTSLNLWGLLQAKAAYAPASAETLIASIEVE